MSGSPAGSHRCLQCPLYVERRLIRSLRLSSGFVCAEERATLRQRQMLPFALAPVRVLLIRAKHLFVAAMLPGLRSDLAQRGRGE